MKYRSIWIWLLSWAWIPLCPAQGVQLDMEIEEFLTLYPELSPPNLRFTGVISKDSLWLEVPWQMDFNFNLGLMSAGSWVSEAARTKKENRALHRAFQEVTEEFDQWYGPHLPMQEDKWVFQDDVEKAVEAPPETWPRRTWHAGNTMVRMRYELVLVPGKDSGEFDKALTLRLRMATNAKTSPTPLQASAPLVARMPIETFGVLFPDLVEQGIGFRGPRVRPEQIGGVAGEWTYWFDRNSLQNYQWYRGVSDFPSSDSSLFAVFRATTVSILEAIEQQLGPPLEQVTSEGLTPAEDGLTFLKSRWAVEGQQITVELALHPRNKGFGYYLKWRMEKAEEQLEEKTYK